MAESVAVLKGKYQRALVTIRELTQERDRAIASQETMQKTEKQVEKNIRYLCETILKKDRTRPVKKKEEGIGKREEENWGRMPLLELIANAQASLEGYFPSVQNMIDQMLKLVQDRSAVIAKLRRENEEAESEKAEAVSRVLQDKNDEIESIRKKHEEVLEGIRRELGEGTSKKAIEKILEHEEGQRQREERARTKRLEKPLNASSSSFSPEDSDHMEDAVSDAGPAMVGENMMTMPIPTGPPVKSTPKIKEAAAATADLLTSRTKRLCKGYADVLGEQEKIVIKLMGKYGCSRQITIKNAAKKHFPDAFRSSSGLGASLHKLVNSDSFTDLSSEFGDISPLVSCQTISVPGNPKLNIYTLTSTGKMLYMYLYEKEPVKSEAEKITAQHTTLVHGYGIMATAELIKTLPFTKRFNGNVECMTRDAAHSIKTGENTSYIPDIILTISVPKKNSTEGETEEKKFYFEYETTACSDTDFFAKCSKITRFGTSINIIVPNDESLKKLEERIRKWREQIREKPETFHAEKTVTIHYSTYNEIKKKSEEDPKHFPWMHETTISPPKKGGNEN